MSFPKMQVLPRSHDRLTPVPYPDYPKEAKIFHRKASKPPADDGRPSEKQIMRAVKPPPLRVMHRPHSNPHQISSPSSSQIRKRTKIAPGYDRDPFNMNKSIPGTIKPDQERLLEEGISLKMENNSFKAENVRLKTKINQMDREIAKRDEFLDELRSKAGEKHYYVSLQQAHIVTNLKQTVKDLRSELRSKEDDLEKLKKSIKFTQIAELETELEVYVEECNRLKRHIMDSAKPMSRGRPVNSIDQAQGQVITKLNKEKLALEKTVQSLQEEITRLKLKVSNAERTVSQASEEQHRVRSIDPDLEVQMSKVKEDLSTKGKTLAQAEEKIRQQTTMIRNLQEQVQTTAQDKEILRNKNKVLQQNLSEAKEQLIALERRETEVALRFLINKLASKEVPFLQILQGLGGESSFQALAQRVEEQRVVIPEQYWETLTKQYMNDRGFVDLSRLIKDVQPLKPKVRDSALKFFPQELEKSKKKLPVSSDLSLKDSPSSQQVPEDSSQASLTKEDLSPQKIRYPDEDADESRVNQSEGNLRRDLFDESESVHRQEESDYNEEFEEEDSQGFSRFKPEVVSSIEDPVGNPQPKSRPGSISKKPNLQLEVIEYQNSQSRGSLASGEEYKTSLGLEEEGTQPQIPELRNSEIPEETRQPPEAIIESSRKQEVSQRKSIESSEESDRFLNQELVREPQSPVSSASHHSATEPKIASSRDSQTPSPLPMDIKAQIDETLSHEAVVSVLDSGSEKAFFTPREPVLEAAQTEDRKQEKEVDSPKDSRRDLGLVESESGEPMSSEGYAFDGEPEISDRKLEQEELELPYKAEEGEIGQVPEALPEDSVPEEPQIYTIPTPSQDVDPTSEVSVIFQCASYKQASQDISLDDSPDQTDFPPEPIEEVVIPIIPQSTEAVQMLAQPEVSNPVPESHVEPHSEIPSEALEIDETNLAAETEDYLEQRREDFGIETKPPEAVFSQLPIDQEDFTASEFPGAAIEPPISYIEERRDNVLPEAKVEPVDTVDSQERRDEAFPEAKPEYPADSPKAESKTYHFTDSHSVSPLRDSEGRSRQSGRSPFEEHLADTFRSKKPWGEGELEESKTPSISPVPANSIIQTLKEEEKYDLQSVHDKEAEPEQSRESIASTERPPMSPIHSHQPSVLGLPAVPLDPGFSHGGMDIPDSDSDLFDAAPALDLEGICEIVKQNLRAQKSPAGLLSERMEAAITDKDPEQAVHDLSLFLQDPPFLLQPGVGEQLADWLWTQARSQSWVVPDLLGDLIGGWDAYELPVVDDKSAFIENEAFPELQNPSKNESPAQKLDNDILEIKTLGNIKVIAEALLASNHSVRDVFEDDAGVISEAEFLHGLRLLKIADLPPEEFQMMILTLSGAEAGGIGIEELEKVFNVHGVPIKERERDLSEPGSRDAESPEAMDSSEASLPMTPKSPEVQAEVPIVSEVPPADEKPSYDKEPVRDPHPAAIQTHTEVSAPSLLSPMSGSVRLVSNPLSGSGSVVEHVQDPGLQSPVSQIPAAEVMTDTAGQEESHGSDSFYEYIGERGQSPGHAEGKNKR